MSDSPRSDIAWIEFIKKGNQSVVANLSAEIERELTATKLKLASAEARVKELEGLVITGIHKFDGGVGVAITLPEHLTPTIGKTLGEAMTAKGGQS